MQTTGNTGAFVENQQYGKKKAKKAEKRTEKGKESNFKIVVEDDKIATLQIKVQQFQREHERAPTADELNAMYPEVYA